MSVMIRGNWGGGGGSNRAAWGRQEPLRSPPPTFFFQVDRAFVRKYFIDETNKGRTDQNASYASFCVLFHRLAKVLRVCLPTTLRPYNLNSSTKSAASTKPSSFDSRGYITKFSSRLFVAPVIREARQSDAWLKILVRSAALIPAENTRILQQKTCNRKMGRYKATALFLILYLSRMLRFYVYLCILKKAGQSMGE